MKKSKKGALILSLILCVIHILPFYLLIMTSFKPINDLSSKWLLPSQLNFDNFVQAWQGANLGTAFKNNSIITIVSLALIVLVGSSAAYPLARFQTKCNKFFYFLFVSVMIVPPLTILVPLYQFYIDIQAMNTYWGIILLQVTFHLPITIFLYTGFISTIPRELDEAAMMDGMNKFSLFFKMILPLLKPVTATVLIMDGVAIWNDYQFSLFFLQSLDMRTVTVSLAAFFGPNTNNVGLVASGSLLAALPLTLLFLSLQRQFISGLSSGAVKG
jgi:raffinose/stachyose/melibiose transport system permease protein